MFFIYASDWEIRETTLKGRGVFAKKTIEPGVVLGDYVGTVLKTAEVDLEEKERNLYLLYYHDEASVYPDLSKAGVHLFNHSCAPNCWMYVYKGHTLFFTLRHIFPGEELTVSYLLSPQTGYCRSCTHSCNCGHRLCTGSMHLSQERYTTWNVFREKEEKRTKKARVTYGKPLRLLDAYPPSIPDDSVYILFGNEEVAPQIMKNKQLPSIKAIRKYIRETGRCLQFRQLNITVWGVIDDTLISSVS